MCEDYPEYTHIVSFYGVRCYFDEVTGDLEGINWLYDKLIPLAVLIHNSGATIAHYAMVDRHLPDGFPLKILKELKDEDNKRKHLGN